MSSTDNEEVVSSDDPEEIPHAQNLKKCIKKTLKLHVAIFIYEFAGGCAYLYLENCYEHPPQIDFLSSFEQRVWTLCVTECMQNFTLDSLHFNYSLLEDNGYAQSACTYSNGTVTVSLVDSSWMELCVEVHQKLMANTPHCTMSTSELAKWLYLAFTITHTIGYGDIYPRSQAGKIFTIFYALPGILITGVFYIHAGRLINALSHKLYSIITTRIFRTAKEKVVYCPFRVTLTNLVLLTISFGLLTKMMMDPEFEGLDAFHAGYLNFTTFTTIGFGDLTYSYRRMDITSLSSMCTYLVYLVGYSCFAALLSSATEIFEGPSTKKLPTKLIKHYKRS